MCGRFSRSVNAEEAAHFFSVSVVKEALEPSFNIAPTQAVQAVVQNARGTRGLVALKWGLIPSWSRDPKVASKLINARSETVAEKPSFRESFQARRCLVLATGFYEWKKGKKQPYYIHFPDNPLVAMAGVYDFWTSPTGEKVASCSVLTRAANEAISEIHHRMPVILNPSHYALWLDKSKRHDADLAPCLQAWPAEDTAWHPVSERINSVRFNAPEALEAIDESDLGPLFKEED